jgi:dUTPase
MPDLYFLLAIASGVAIVTSFVFSFLAVFSNGGAMKCSVSVNGILPKKYSKSTYLLCNNLTAGIKLRPGERKEITTGVHIAFHPGVYGITSDLPYGFLTAGSMVCRQVFDDPTGEIKVILANISKDVEINVDTNQPVALFSFVQGTLKYL